MDAINNKNKIIWAFDSTQDPAKAQNIIKELKTWAKHLSCEVQPVSVFSKSAFNLPIEFKFSWENKLQDVAKRSAAKFIKKTQVKNFLEPEALFFKASSNRQMAIELAKYAERKNAILIVANTHAKKTWNPVRLGGFAETLMATSRVPVLLLNPHAVVSAKIPSILFPTDFSKNSKNAMLRLEPLVKALNSKILLYNEVETPNLYPSDISDFADDQTFKMGALLNDIEKSRIRKGSDWGKTLAAKNIENALLIQRQRKHLAADILDIAKKNKTRLIALASSTGPLAQAMVGSVSRDIVLGATCPVLVFYRPKLIRERKLKVKQTENGKYNNQRESRQPLHAQKS